MSLTLALTLGGTTRGRRSSQRGLDEVERELVLVQIALDHDRAFVALSRLGHVDVGARLAANVANVGAAMTDDGTDGVAEIDNRQTSKQTTSIIRIKLGEKMSHTRER